MGQESICRVRFDGAISEGKAILETQDLFFRGDFRLHINLHDITTLEAQDGELRVSFPEGIAIFELGPDAAKWYDRIRNPRGLLDRMGIKPGSRGAVFGIDDTDFFLALEARGVYLTDEGTIEPDLDFVVYLAEHAADLENLPLLRDNTKPEGAIWIISTKGRNATIKDTEIMAIAREHGLVDTRVVSFSSTHTGLRLVRRRDQR